MKIKKIVDISMVLEEDLPSDPEIQIPHIQRRNHKDTAPEMGNYFPVNEFLTAAELPPLE